MLEVEGGCPHSNRGILPGKGKHITPFMHCAYAWYVYYSFIYVWNLDLSFYLSSYPSIFPFLFGGRLV